MVRLNVVPWTWDFDTVISLTMQLEESLLQCIFPQVSQFRGGETKTEQFSVWLKVFHLLSDSVRSLSAKVVRLHLLDIDICLKVWQNQCINSWFTLPKCFFVKTAQFYISHVWPQWDDCPRFRKKKTPQSLSGNTAIKTVARQDTHPQNTADRHTVAADVCSVSIDAEANCTIGPEHKAWREYRCGIVHQRESICSLPISFYFSESLLVDMIADLQWAHVTCWGC